MSFFGQNNNQQGSGFGGFGSNNNAGTGRTSSTIPPGTLSSSNAAHDTDNAIRLSGFGQPSNTNTGFGATSGATGGGLFGTSNNDTTNTGFGGT